MIQSPGHFIANARKYIQLLEDVLRDDLDQADDCLITRDKRRKVGLPFALLDDEVKHDIIHKTGDAP